MSIGLRTREQLEHAHRYNPKAPRTRQEAGIHDGDHLIVYPEVVAG